MVEAFTMAKFQVQSWNNKFQRELLSRHPEARRALDRGLDTAAGIVQTVAYLKDSQSAALALPTELSFTSPQGVYHHQVGVIDKQNLQQFIREQPHPTYGANIVLNIDLKRLGLNQHQIAVIMHPHSYLPLSTELLLDLMASAGITRTDMWWDMYLRDPGFFHRNVMMELRTDLYNPDQWERFQNATLEIALLEGSGQYHLHSERVVNPNALGVNSYNSDWSFGRYSQRTGKMTTSDFPNLIEDTYHKQHVELERELLLRDMRLYILQTGTTSAERSQREFVRAPSFG